MHLCSMGSEQVYFRAGFHQKKVKTVVSVTVGIAMMTILLYQVMKAAGVRVLTTGAVMKTQEKCEKSRHRLFV